MKHSTICKKQGWQAHSFKQSAKPHSALNSRIRAHRRNLVSVLFPLMKAEQGNATDEQFCRLTANMMRAWFVMELELLSQDENNLLTFLAKGNYDLDALKVVLKLNDVKGK